MEKSVSILIPVYKPDKKFNKLLVRLNHQTRRPEKIVLMITVPDDWSRDQAEGSFYAYQKLSEIPMEAHFLTPDEFDHGGTRNLGMTYCDTDYVICMTQDAVAANADLIGELLKPFEEDFEGAHAGFLGDREILISYARQLPDKKCREAEKYTRSFNYPAKSRVKTIDDLDTLGIKTFFASNVCAAYKREAYVREGGFPERTIFNEDMIFAGRMIRKGFAIAYAADAKVVHSHNLGWGEQLHRNFDLAVSQADAPDVFEGVPSEGEGIRLVVNTAKHLTRIHKPWLIPNLVITSGFKYIGYFLGKRYKRLPKRMVMALTLSKRHWSE